MCIHWLSILPVESCLKTATSIQQYRGWWRSPYLTSPSSALVHSPVRPPYSLLTSISTQQDWKTFPQRVTPTSHTLTLHLPHSPSFHTPTLHLPHSPSVWHTVTWDPQQYILSLTWRHMLKAQHLFKKRHLQTLQNLIQESSSEFFYIPVIFACYPTIL